MLIVSTKYFDLGSFLISPVNYPFIYDHVSAFFICFELVYFSWVLSLYHVYTGVSCISFEPFTFVFGERNNLEIR